MDDAGEWIPQAAAIPVRDGMVCLVSSRSGRRWVVPKGKIDAGHTADQTALIEAWEEAGLVGQLLGGSIGSFVYSKYDRSYHVTAFLMSVTHVSPVWPERRQRQRRWIRVEEATELVTDAGLRELLSMVAQNLTVLA